MYWMANADVSGAARQRQECIRVESYRKEQADPVLLIVGGSMDLSDVAMDDRAQLNPAFNRWLMAIPDAWDDCALSITPSGAEAAARVHRVSERDYRP